jgi:hypothetical protein
MYYFKISTNGTPSELDLIEDLVLLLNQENNAYKDN